jgi:hypothetical protein
MQLGSKVPARQHSLLIFVQPRPLVAQLLDPPVYMLAFGRK